MSEIAEDDLLGDKDGKRRKGRKRGRDEPDIGLTRTNFKTSKPKRRSDEFRGNSHHSESDGGLPLENEIIPEQDRLLEQRRNEDVIVEERQCNENKDSNDDDDGPSGKDHPDLASLNRNGFGGKKQDKPKIKTWPPKYGYAELIFAIVAVIVFIADIVLDIRLMFTYYTASSMNLFWVTLGFIVVPSFISGIVSIVWTYIDEDERRSTSSKVLLFFRIILTFIQLGRAFRYLEFLYYVVKCWRTDSDKKREDISLKAIKQKRDAVILGLVDGFLESALQLMLQLSLAIIFQLNMDILRVLSLLTSWLSTSLTLTSYYRTIRRADPDTYNANYKVSVIYYLWRVSELGPRFILLALGVAFLQPWIFVGVGIHFVLALIMHIIIRPELEGVCISWLKILFLFLISFVSIFCFVNLKRGQTWKRVLTYYVLYYTENFIIAGIILSLSPGVNCLSSYRWHCASFALLPGAFLHLLFQALYYGVCHPHLEAVRCSVKKCCIE